MTIGISDEHVALHESVRRWVETHADTSVAACRDGVGRRRAATVLGRPREDGLAGSAPSRASTAVRATGSAELAVVLEELGPHVRARPVPADRDDVRGHRRDRHRRAEGAMATGSGRRVGTWRDRARLGDAERERGRGHRGVGRATAGARRRGRRACSSLPLGTPPAGAGFEWGVFEAAQFQVTALHGVDATRGVAAVEIERQTHRTRSAVARRRRVRQPPALARGIVDRGRVCGRRGVVCRDCGRVRQGTGAVRSSDRPVPGREAPMRRHAVAPRARARRGLGRGSWWRGRRRTAGSASWRRPSLGARSSTMPRTASRCSVASDTRGSTTHTST